ncbi:MULTISPECIES: Eco57I restriction-modification methylase domain-containing protein [Rhodanobacter]|uniref:Eco57I restriction-modification methylase domain-containing protein n=1 Tax=Rhodanobacter TaxID=75309 RepID=UPI000489F420|nr:MULTISPECIES: Eco57I restriction-modification methylase domain-containing protein [Rhodanobacter]KZC18689.1 modification methylase PaeR7I [Rhodanobacter denitrificans]UJJ49499.1 Eco57I restriction-modification methylase domain-containing protein [Rhodanobacter denitrificans]UJM92213.1 Eco57I restriction-modification methylase domain-containing protein [Rhodanobacter denitrificans]UJM95742.1 Eco57I restriction-modification methylase domain-containing protein [Rhodanobacter denitrificans]UJN2
MNLSLDLFDHAARAPEIEAAISHMARHDETDRGAVFTRPEVVDAILDLAGYRSDRPLHRLRLLEPSFGAGDFLLRVVHRLWSAFVRDGGTPATAPEELRDAIIAVELHQATFDLTAQRLVALLRQQGLSPRDADALCASWLIRDDFLLAPLNGPFDFVVGNPPYVRQERIPAALLNEYRRRFHTLYDRADLYVPFFEHALDLLGDEGVLGYICANRWLKNRYGGPLREKVTNGYWLKYFIDMESTDAFHSEVIAYPAITIFQRAAPESTGRQATRAVAAGAATSLPVLVDALLDAHGSEHVAEFKLDSMGPAPLLLDDIPRLVLLRRMEHELPTLEQAGCKVGIGVATGCDRVFIDAMDALPVEAERKLPLVMARDLVDGSIRWGGKAVLNPFDETGQLVPLESFPRFKHYLDTHRDSVAGRHVAQRNPGGWYRTIDRIQPGLLETPKLLVPDIKGEGVFVMDEGRYYPHHNLYFITSGEWDLRALQAVLRSSLTLMVVATYCTRMAGGFLRFQAQYLRRIRLPRWRNVDERMRDRLIAAAATKDQDEVDAPIFELYGLSSAEALRTRQIADAARVGKGSLQ